MPYKVVFIYGAEHPGVFLLRILIGLYGAFQLHRMVNCIGFFLALCKTETPQKTALNRSFCKRQGTDFIWVVAWINRSNLCHPNRSNCAT